MQVGAHIREHRARLALSQDDLAARIYVSRQTISNWENDKTYPDVQSLLLLSAVFDATVDELIKGDVDAMDKTVNEDAGKMKQLEWYALACMVLGAAALYWAGYQFLSGWAWHTIPTVMHTVTGWTALFVITHRIEKLKRKHDVITYSEVLAFTRGERIDRGTRASRRVRARTRKQRAGIRDGAILPLINFQGPPSFSMHKGNQL
ncbi:helix-turn-helix domain protein [Coriobacterium glomerans PW2]|uniref:Helix-turn-helix domain protein n=1 Tax=Coriobacterium glomerans (strain ATCC 49209 / DSM 20642 / JCM 10262 / PW2) TaxID=700015 RepID=F2N6Z3_CORGP|nr:helix-turn-helix domain-containing protein [Coriobacterium glomerans]AEB06192.1 helix-turn-helix domain protein [Coriobacterium glomerans PW2]